MVKTVQQKVKCIGGDMHRVVMGEGGLTFPDHPNVWEQAQVLENLAKLGGKISPNQVKTGCIALAAYAKLGHDVMSMPKVGTRMIDVMNKRAAMRTRLQKAAEPEDLAMTLQHKIHDAVSETLRRRCSYRNRPSPITLFVNRPSSDYIFSLTRGDNNPSKWVASYPGEQWEIFVQKGWLDLVFAAGHAVVSGHLITAIDPNDSKHVVAIYECTSKDQWEGAHHREAHIKNGKLVWV